MTKFHTSKMSMEGWWMVQTTVRPVLTVLRTVRITMAAALASRPLVGSSCRAETLQACNAQHAGSYKHWHPGASAPVCVRMRPGNGPE